MHSTTDINVSLEIHLLNLLTPLPSILPNHLADDLARYVTQPTQTIPYQTLLAISQWSRSDSGLQTLNSHNLNPQDYSIVSLLAGTVSSPERNFGDYVPPKEPEEIQADRVRERKAITALINSLLSIGCVAFAAWWAADKTGWNNEWKVLFALFAAIVVATAEAGLYIIWQSRRSKSIQTRVKKRAPALRKKVDPDSGSASQPPEEAVVVSNEPSTLRQRR